MTSLCRLSTSTALLATLAISSLAFADDIASNQEATFNEKKNRGTQFYNERKYEAAIPLFQAAYTLNPDPLLLYNLGQAHRKLNRNVEALNYFRFFLRASTDGDPILREKAEAIVKELESTTGKSVTSTTSGKNSTLTKNQDSGSLFNQLNKEGTELYQQGNYEACIEKFQTAFSINPDSLLLYNLGQAHRKLKQEREALNYYQFYLRTAGNIAPEMRSKVEGYVQELRQAIDDKEQRSRQPTVVVRTTERRPRPLWRLIVGPVLAAGGAATLGIGAWGLSGNGTCVDTPSDPMLHCSKVYDTAGLGGGLIGAGSVLLLGGVLLAALPGSQVTVERTVDSRPTNTATAQSSSLLFPSASAQPGIHQRSSYALPALAGTE
jgi:tetratricopeptide (TPR) repeat protein